MSQSTKATTEIRNAIDQVEEAYEFMLAYAAQGRKQEPETEGASQIRGYLERMRDALRIIEQNLPVSMSGQKGGEAFAKHVSSDIAVMMSVIELLLGQSGISSDMVDNTNGLISVRSFLTDLFFIDQVVLPSRMNQS